MTPTPTDPGKIDLDDLLKALTHAASMYSAPGAPALLHQAIAAIVALREQLIWGFYENEIPEYQQGGKVHELHELVTAKECSGLVANIKALRGRVAEVENRYKLYKHVAKGVRGALDGEHTQRDILKIFDETIARTKVAEACMVELAGACRIVLAELPEDDEGIEIGDLQRLLCACRTALAASQARR